MFRGKESSNRIELSWLVQDLLNFGVLGSLRLWGWGWVDGGEGWLMGAHHTCSHTHTCMHTHTRTWMCGKHDNFMQMAAPIGFGEIPGIPYDVIRMRVHAHECACACVGDTLSPPPTHIHPPPTPQGGPQNQSKFNSTWTNRDISIPFEDLKSVETSPPMGGCIIWWVGGWVGGLMGGVRSKH